ncbi:1-(5-phosphoribosyl)-5-[(5-phosphoribosylamino)methylideneamino]imidazole-4-carboxamide isomerase [Calycomorphotria hydatis]|uniref:1-(5-phosphoribosyl)-5-[(5-phosphoribosylamino)methylideneamino] imidazole-4-carboxamide isomerase n=1 Tax=Calycomorphotria hydatis TaxID=2528027 RepID=A0A517TAF2_9PLAN|nr:1-(5-phosphoribosyl)-5-[(5-phosphoribosylamino)methylideneamino]imidazole-4-carboxamide isomerase [Calycomorphotria hydatis]QDT65347.1 1-(5-phosphoribosyl)-5-[(5-phosphoribosylamino)methylideneamino] imidazole-4-carboxamide isomerase [Calycomorphotria hydatis]
MLEILPAIDIRGGKCVRLRQGDYNQETVFGDDPVDMAHRWADAGATRLHLVDLDAAKSGKPTNLDVIEKIRDSVSIPCQLGGGIRDDAALETVLHELAIDRAIVGTAALKNPEWFSDAAKRFHNRLILGLDARDGMVATEGWLEVSQTSAVELASKFQYLPLAAVVYTNIANDGMMQGIDDATINSYAELADMGFHVIASGGVTTVDDIKKLALKAKKHPNLTGVITGRALYEGTLTVEEAIGAVQ